MATETRRMTSNVTLNIEIGHEDNLDLNASEIAGEVARFLASRLGLSEGALYIVDGRRHITGPVEIFLRSAAITSREPLPWQRDECGPGCSHLTNDEHRRERDARR